MRLYFTRSGAHHFIDPISSDTINVMNFEIELDDQDNKDIDINHIIVKIPQLTNTYYY